MLYRLERLQRIGKAPVMALQRMGAGVMFTAQEPNTDPTH